jgi:hypothetical protein
LNSKNKQRTKSLPSAPHRCRFRFLVASLPSGALLLCAKHLLFEANRTKGTGIAAPATMFLGSLGSDGPSVGAETALDYDGKPNSLPRIATSNITAKKA